MSLVEIPQCGGLLAPSARTSCPQIIRSCSG